MRPKYSFEQVISQAELACGMPWFREGVLETLPVVLGPGHVEAVCLQPIMAYVRGDLPPNPTKLYS